MILSSQRKTEVIWGLNYFEWKWAVLPVELELLVHTSWPAGYMLESASAKHIVRLGGVSWTFEWNEATKEVIKDEMRWATDSQSGAKSPFAQRLSPSNKMLCLTGQIKVSNDNDWADVQDICCRNRISNELEVFFYNILSRWIKCIFVQYLVEDIQSIYWCTYNNNVSSDNYPTYRFSLFLFMSLCFLPPNSHQPELVHMSFVRFFTLSITPSYVFLYHRWNQFVVLN